VGDPAIPTNWVAYGRPVLAAGPGVVVAVTSDVADNRVEGGRLVLPASLDPASAAAVTGNLVVIDHGSGEHTFYAHLRRGSIPVRVGQRVRARERIGEIGFSGDTGFHVHLHFEVRSAPTLNGGRALPPYFHGYYRHAGDARVRVARASIDPGEVVEVP
jgi:murein DD-endopeptidase MepM/ murein hydrolase activator NlpD